MTSEVQTKTVSKIGAELDSFRGLVASANRYFIEQEQYSGIFARSSDLNKEGRGCFSY